MEIYAKSDAESETGRLQLKPPCHWDGPCNTALYKVSQIDYPYAAADLGLVEAYLMRPVQAILALRTLISSLAPVSCCSY
jgi:hypothetical protein